MRITNNMMVNSLIYNVNKNLSNMTKMQDQLATGKKVHTASDDPVAAAKIIKYRTDLSEYSQYERNTEDAMSWLETSESSMMDINSVLQRARELTVRAATGTNTDEDVKKIGDELKQLKKQLIMDGNFSFAGRYVFSGYHTEEPLFDENGNFNIGVTDIDINNPPETRYQIGVGEEIKISTNGLNLFGYVADTGVYVDKMANGSSTNGVASNRAEFKGDFILNNDYTSGGQISLDIGGQGYNLDMTNLDLSWVDTSKIADTTSAKQTIVSAIQNAPASPATSPQTSISDVADVYFDENDKLVIRSKNYSPVSISQTSGTSLGLTQDVAGNSVGQASISTPIILDSEVGTNFDGKEFAVTINGKTERVTIGTVAAPQTVANLATAIQSAIDSKFPTSPVSVSEAGGVITFTSNEAIPDGQVPSLDIYSVKSTKSKLMEDFDQVIADIESGNRSGISSFITKMDENMKVILTNLSDIGARTNRMELVINRINENSVTFTKLLSNAQDADMSEVIMYLKNSENVYRASLSTGAKVIQPSLIDFLR